MCAVNQSFVIGCGIDLVQSSVVFPLSQGQSLLFGDLTLLLGAVWWVCWQLDKLRRFEAEVRDEAERYGLRWKALMEVRKLRRQLTEAGEESCLRSSLDPLFSFVLLPPPVNSVFPDAHLAIAADLGPPSEAVLLQLRQMLLAASPHHVARKVTLGPDATEQQRRHMKRAYSVRRRRSRRGRMRRRRRRRGQEEEERVGTQKEMKRSPSPPAEHTRQRSSLRSSALAALSRGPRVAALPGAPRQRLAAADASRDGPQSRVAPDAPSSESARQQPAGGAASDLPRGVGQRAVPRESSLSLVTSAVEIAQFYISAGWIAQDIVEFFCKTFRRRAARRYQ